MNNLKKIGLTALAGSLVATSVAYAAELSVSGSASMSVQNHSQKATGKNVKMGNSVYFTGGGETDGGLNVNLSFELDQGTPAGDGPFDSHFVSIGNDTLGTLTVHGHGGSNSAAALDTTAAGDLWDSTLGITTAGTSAARMAPLASTSGDNLVVYTLPSMIDGLSVGVSSQLATTGGSASTAFGVTYAGVDGLSVSYGKGDSEGVTDVSGDQTIMKASYAYGPITVSASQNDFDHTTNTIDQRVTSYGLSYTVSDAISLSYGEETIDRALQVKDIEVKGYSASYTTGGMTVSVKQVSADHTDHTAVTSDNEMWKLGLSLAF
jgi:outer membrane protein OmpU